MAFQLGPFLASSTTGMGALGAIVGGSAAAAKNYKDFRNGKVTLEEAGKDVGKEAAGAGIATAISAAAVGVVGGGLTISVITALAAAAGAKYAWDYAMDMIPTEEEPEEENHLETVEGLADAMIDAHDEHPHVATPSAA
ncbi:MAG: magnetosome protein MamC [Zetaproteobacteria bacterium]|nr:magnetosome protein MamC [Zetaproteobacteria bacterium]